MTSTLCIQCGRLPKYKCPTCHQPYDLHGLALESFGTNLQMKMIVAGRDLVPKHCNNILITSCSVQCCKQHRQNPCSAPVPLSEPNFPEQSNINYDFPTEDTVDPEKLELLEKSTELRKCLENPHVRKILELLDKSPHPDDLIQEYMQEPIFTELVDACLNVVEPPSLDDNS